MKYYFFPKGIFFFTGLLRISSFCLTIWNYIDKLIYLFSSLFGTPLACRKVKSAATVPLVTKTKKMKAMKIITCPKGGRIPELYCRNSCLNYSGERKMGKILLRRLRSLFKDERRSWLQIYKEDIHTSKKMGSCGVQSWASCRRCPSVFCGERCMTMGKNISGLSIFHIDNGGRRSGQDRRRFAYSNHIPERRLGEDHGMSRDRRSGKDRRELFCDRFHSDLGSGRRFERRLAHR